MMQHNTRADLPPIKIMTAESTLTKNEILSQLTLSPHGKLIEYCPVGFKAVEQDPEFYAHLIAYDFVRGQIRDSKVAFPMISLASKDYPKAFVSNSLAHLALLSPRDLLRGLRFYSEMRHHDYAKFGALYGTLGHGKDIKRTVARFLRAREANWGWWTRTALQHRKSIKELYALCHIKPSEAADQIIFKGIYPKGTVFNTVSQLKNMSPSEAAGYILNQKIPFLVAQGALGAKIKEPELVLALISRMSPTEFTTNTKMLERLGIKTNPALRSAYQEGLKRASVSKANTFKATRAAEVLEDDNPLKEKLLGLQEKQIETMGGIDGDWLILADKSGSMQLAIEVARKVAATLARSVKGTISLVFFDTSPRYIDCTGRTYDDILKETQHIEAQGGTSIGVGLQYALERKLPADAITIISDGAENAHPQFAACYEESAQSMHWGKKVPVYFYRITGTDHPMYTVVFLENCNKVGADLTIRDLTGGIDFYSLPNLISSMRVRKYSLVDEIYATPLLDLDTVLPPLESA